MKKITKPELTKFKLKHSKAFKLMDDFEDDFLMFFNSHEELKGYFNFFNFQFKGKFKKENLSEATDRVLSHWEKLGIIPANRNSNKGWREYGYLDQVWTSIVIHLRRFNYSLNDIKYLKTEYIEQLNEYTTVNYPLLALYFVYSTFYKDNAYLIVYAGGKAELTLRSDYLEVISKNQDIPNYILIDLTAIMKDIEDTFEVKFPNPKTTLNNLNEKENKLLEIYRNPNVIELSLKKDAKTETINYKQKKKLNENRLFAALQGIDFGSMSVTKSNNKVVDITINKSEKL